MNSYNHQPTSTYTRWRVCITPPCVVSKLCTVYIYPFIYILIHFYICWVVECTCEHPSKCPDNIQARICILSSISKLETRNFPIWTYNVREILPSQQQDLVYIPATRNEQCLNAKLWTNMAIHHAHINHCTAIFFSHQSPKNELCINTLNMAEHEKKILYFYACLRRERRREEAGKQNVYTIFSRPTCEYLNMERHSFWLSWIFRYSRLQDFFSILFFVQTLHLLMQIFLPRFAVSCNLRFFASIYCNIVIIYLESSLFFLLIPVVTKTILKK